MRAAFLYFQTKKGKFMQQQNQISVEKVQQYLGELYLNNKLLIESLQQQTAELEQLRNQKAEADKREPDTHGN